MMACTSVGTDQGDPAQPSEQAPAPEPTPPTETATPPKTAAITVQMTAATLANDCAPAPAAAQAQGLTETRDGESMREGDSADDYACQQSSMQLSVVAAADSPRLQLTVTKVEFFDDKGTMLGPMIPRTPTVWTDEGTYRAWDESILGGQELSVSYTLSEPPWHKVGSRWGQLFVLKATITANGEEQIIQRNIEVTAPSIYPVDVET